MKLYNIVAAFWVEVGDWFIGKRTVGFCTLGRGRSATPVVAEASERRSGTLIELESPQTRGMGSCFTTSGNIELPRPRNMTNGYNMALSAIDAQVIALLDEIADRRYQPVAGLGVELWALGKARP